MTISADPCNASEIKQALAPANPEGARHAKTAADQQVDSGAASFAPRHKPGSEEPDMALEPDLPSDGRDAIGEAMIRDLPQRPELSEPASQPDPSSQAH